MTYSKSEEHKAEDRLSLSDMFIFLLLFLLLTCILAIILLSLLLLFLKITNIGSETFWVNLSDIIVFYILPIFLFLSCLFVFIVGNDFGTNDETANDSKNNYNDILDNYRNLLLSSDINKGYKKREILVGEWNLDKKCGLKVELNLENEKSYEVVNKNLINLFSFNLSLSNEAFKAIMSHVLELEDIHERYTFWLKLEELILETKIADRIDYLNYVKKKTKGSQYAILNDDLNKFIDKTILNWIDSYDRKQVEKEHSFYQKHLVNK